MLESSQPPKPEARSLRVAALSVVVLTCCSITAADDRWTLTDMKSGSGGSLRYNAKPIPERFRNMWPAQEEASFQARAAKIIAAQSTIKPTVNTYFENEKRNYGFLMAGILSEDKLHAARCLRVLQTRDHQHEVWHRETAGIDYYAAFTLKHQMRKFFYFGDVLDPTYRNRMFEGGKHWTTQDPLKRPHYAFNGAGPGWGPDVKNSWVDVRSTENLFLMRVTSVYLMAETTGNNQTAAKYKKMILDYAATLFRIGMGEWDSENYHGHSIAPMLNLYDFAKDDKVRLAAKACLDFFFAAGAVKYLDGGFNGPTKRDYNHVQPFGGSAANMLWVAFGGPREKQDHWESDEVHLVTSAYRPPMAVLDLARKNFAKPVTIYASKPEYTATTGLRKDSKPAYLETQHIGHHFQMGSLAGGTRPGKQDVNGFKIITSDSRDGAVVIQGVPGADPYYVGSPQYNDGKVSGENRVAQYDNLAIWLVSSGKSPWTWVVPNSCTVTTKRGVTFVKARHAWVAFTPLSTTELVSNESLTASLTTEKRRKNEVTKKVKYPGHHVLAATGTGQNFCGFAIEVGEAETHGSFNRFVEAVLDAEVDTSELSSGIARYKSARDQWLGFHWNDNPNNLGVWKSGKRHDFTAHSQSLYRTSRIPQTISAVWGTGALRVETTGYAFECSVDADGRVRFENGKR